MVFFETITAVLNTGTAVSVAKFVFEKVMDYINNKPAKEASPDIVELKNEIEVLKNQMEAKDREDISEAEVSQIKEKIEKIEIGASSLPREIVSADEFKRWLEKEDLEIEDEALILKRELEYLIENANEMGLKDQKKFELNQLASTIGVNLQGFKEARFSAQLSGLSSDKQEQIRMETLVRKNIFQIKDYLKSIK
jgi:site-specific recombinase XerC